MYNHPMFAAVSEQASEISSELPKKRKAVLDDFETNLFQYDTSPEVVDITAEQVVQGDPFGRMFDMNKLLRNPETDVIFNQDTFENEEIELLEEIGNNIASQESLNIDNYYKDHERRIFGNPMQARVPNKKQPLGHLSKKKSAKRLKQNHDCGAQNTQWTYEEEIFLMGAIMHRWFQYGSLTPVRRKGEEGKEVWPYIKNVFDKNRLLYAQRTGKNKPDKRSHDALSRHFKSMKTRKPAPLDDLYRRWIAYYEPIVGRAKQ